MDEQQSRITEDLSGVLRGEIRCDSLTVSAYASDASLYEIYPLGVAFPLDTEDVRALARYSSDTGTPLVARGAGTSITGSSLGRGLIVDFSRHMRRIEQIGEETIRVQPGIVRDKLNQVLREYGRYFPPDPSNSAITTLGGMISVDAAGSRCVRVGSTRDHVQSLDIVLAGGEMIQAGSETLEEWSIPANDSSGLASDSVVLRPAADMESPVKRNIVGRLTQLLSTNAELIQQWQPPLVRNCSGYLLRGILSDQKLHLARMLVGSEGTLGLITEATLHTAPLPAHRGVVLLLFGQLESALRAVMDIARQQPSACDLLDRRLLSLAREADPRFEGLISPAAEAALLVEQTGFSERQVRDRIRGVVDAVRSGTLRPVIAAEAYEFDDVELLWSLPQTVVPLLTRLKGESRPLPFIEDIAVPPEALPEFVVRAQRVFQQHQVTASLYAHAASGQLHFRPMLPTPLPQHGGFFQALAADLYAAVFAVGGTISGEHGDGLSRTSFVRDQYGPLYHVFQQVKDIFDPQNLMNPGKIISEEMRLTGRNFRGQVDVPPETVELKLSWTPAEFTKTAARCNGCGACKTQSPEVRMCPFFRLENLEEASPRAKANVIRGFCDGKIDPLDFDSPATKRLADLCFNCKQCQLECPTNVDIPHLMIEAKAAYVAAHGLNRTDWILSRAHSFGSLGSASAITANWIIRNPTARWVLERTVGISRRRKLPLFAKRSLLSSLAGRKKELKLPRVDGEPAVAYFVGDYANYHDPDLGRALIAVLQHHGIHVHVPLHQTSSAMAMVSAGDLDAAREVAHHNIRALAELAREGMPILCTEPSAAVCLKQDYPMLVDHPDVGLIASQTIEAGAYLQDLHRQGKLRTDFAPLNLTVGYHTPCHLRALNAGTPFCDLLALIPQLKLRKIEKGCSGMAGAFGLTRSNFRTSIRIGWGLISRMRAGDLDVGATECSGCKMQMEQGTSSPTVHPLMLMALAYGLMPELRRRLKSSGHRLVIS